MPNAQRNRLTQAERRSRTRSALLESAARGLSRYGYSNLALEQVAAEAGYTRGALYHLFDSKEDLALAVVEWVEETWWAYMAPVLDRDGDPVSTLIELARAHAVFCRRDIARVVMTLRIEFSGQDHPVGAAVDAAMRRLVDAATHLIQAGRDSGAIPPTAPPRVLAIAYLAAIEGLVISIAGREPFDEQLAARAAAGLLGVPFEGLHGPVG